MVAHFAFGIPPAYHIFDYVRISWLTVMTCFGVADVCVGNLHVLEARVASSTMGHYVQNKLRTTVKFEILILLATMHLTLYLKISSYVD